MFEMPCCANCSAYLKVNDEVGVCRAHPPVPVMLGVFEQPSKLAGQPNKIVPQLDYYQPMVMKDRWCREHQEVVKLSS